MGIKRATLYYQRKININKKQKELRIRKRWRISPGNIPITVTEE
jgi:hypothetical protein